MSAESFGEEEEEEEEEESDLEGTAPIPKRRKLARDKALTMRVVKHLVRRSLCRPESCDLLRQFLL